MKIHCNLTTFPVFQNEEHQSLYMALVKADADAFYYFHIGSKEAAFKVLQERVYPNRVLLEQCGYCRPRLVSTARP